MTAEEQAIAIFTLYRAGCHVLQRGRVTMADLEAWKILFDRRMMVIQEAAQAAIGKQEIAGDCR